MHDLLINSSTACAPTNFFVQNCSRPIYPDDKSQTSIDEGLDLVWLDWIVEPTIIVIIWTIKYLEVTIVLV